ncbi:bifunctional DNA-formamidopyrimidine glycosylase/DNA-(apurinic or apyrimidinic site) lyase [Citrifermentans bremense]|uniref:bifunctional DNA-formamidopyrimidine glycosylase/DNA-(apurinic or apyrimidinic site) lyase n=1 Tax=Citrifermentans bremense TaxID=60035 RepID=UPI00040455A0|nr:bifunctional DNA-formamidopyrimidine glycosylase/DNA-(apurinic or apyrimidinic site) lyase [Citrifermentans bremense]
MPELPEVEVTRLGIAAQLVGARIAVVAIRSAKLRTMVPQELPRLLAGQSILSLTRRGKYLVITCRQGSLLLHLGMTGHLRLVPAGAGAGVHDHFDLELESGLVLRLNDVRRFGSIHFTSGDPLKHKLLQGIGPEPLTDELTAPYLYRKSRGKKAPLQRFLMDSSVVAGLGNIYAAETLFRCAMLPSTPAGSLSEADCYRLCDCIKKTLAASIEAGRVMDFSVREEKLVYFPQQLFVYGREGLACRQCGSAIERGRLGNRSTFYCPRCQS